MEINRENLIQNISLKIDESLVEKVVLEYVKMVKSLTINSNVSNLRNLLKQQLNTDLDNKTSSADFEKVSQMAIQIRTFYQNNGTYQTMNDGKDPISNNQLGWYTFQSWKLQNDKQYGINEISHRFYINASAKELPGVMQALIQIYSQMDVPFYFKVNCNAQLGTKDAIVLYSSTEQLDNTLAVLSRLEKENPELISRIGLPHILTGNINNWIGYASENKLLQGKDSYTGIMSSSFISAFEKSIMDWIHENPNFKVEFEGRNILLSDYFNSSLKDDTNKDYMQAVKDNYNYAYRMGHLLSVLPRIDSGFNGRIVANLRQLVLQKNIDPNNICFNSDVLKELLELSKQDITRKEQDSSLQQARIMYEKMMNSEGFDYSNQSRDGTRENDMDLPTKKSSGIHR